MSVEKIAKKTNELLVSLEDAMRQATLWSEQRPPEYAFASTAPFACDRMSFEQWLQFVFLPQMNVLLRDGHKLPSDIALLPMAEECFSRSQETDTLLSVLGQIDQLLSSQTQTEGQQVQ